MGRMESIIDNLPDYDGGGKGFPVDIKIKSGSTVIFRIVDKSDDFGMYWESWFYCDDNKARAFIIENDYEGRSVLSRMLGDRENYYRGGFMESAKSDKGKVYIHQGKDPELFGRINEYYNSSFNGKGTSKPILKFVYNAIHRDNEVIDNQNINWCIANKHTKLLRINQKAFTALKAVKDGYGELNEYDISYNKTGTGTNTVYNIMKAGPRMAGVVSGFLTEEELAYETYGIKQVSKLSSARHVLKFLENTVQRVDKVMGSSYYKELLEQKSMEEAEYAKQQSGKSTNIPMDMAVNDNPFDDSDIPFSDDVDAANARLKEATANEKPAPVRGTRIAEDTEPCKFCQELIPKDLDTCPKCFKVLRAPCDECGVPFSVFASECPSCHKVYQPS